MDGSQLYSVTEIALKSPALSELIFFEFQTRDIRSPSLPPKGALFAVYSTPVGIAREVDYRSRTWRFNNKAQLAFSAGVRLVSVGENQSD